MYIFLLLLLITSSLAIDQAPKRRESDNKESFEPRFNNASLCVFHPDFKSITCHSPRGSVECEAFGNVSSFNYRMFGIGKFGESFNFTNTESLKFFLYPKSFESKNFQNYTTEFEGKTYEFYLYHSNVSESLGFRVSNFECYRKLADVIQASTEYFDAKIFGKESTVQIQGEILYMDKPTEKRWLGYFWPYWGIWPLWG